jgi:hypothetical protein
VEMGREGVRERGRRGFARAHAGTTVGTGGRVYEWYVCTCTRASGPRGVGGEGQALPFSSGVTAGRKCAVIIKDRTGASEWCERVASADAGELPRRRLRCTLGSPAALGLEALPGLTPYLSAPREPAQPSELRREPPQPSKL